VLLPLIISRVFKSTTNEAIVTDRNQIFQEVKSQTILLYKKHIFSKLNTLSRHIRNIRDKFPINILTINMVWSRKMPC